MRRSELFTHPLACGHPTSAQAVAGNLITPMVNADSAYPEMLAGIDSARVSISFATYYFKNDAVGNQFCEALAQAVSRGVKVRVLVDGRSLLDRPPIYFKLKNSDIRVHHSFLQTDKFSSIVSRYHRRIVMVDGRLGFSGGMNIMSSTPEIAGHASYYQDVHFKIEGPILSEVQQVFTTDWAAATREILSGPHWFPQLKQAGNASVRTVVSGPGSDRGTLEALLCNVISLARQRIQIVTPYFLPSQKLELALRAALGRGVLVQLLLPQHNIPLVEWAAARHLIRLLEAGGIVSALPPPFEHSKLMTIDDNWCLIGSANWDPRSLFLNKELNLEVHDQLLRKQLGAIIDSKAETAQSLTLSNLTKISKPKQLVGRVAESYL